VNGWQGPGTPEITDIPPALLTPEQVARELTACVTRLASVRRRPQPGQRSWERKQHAQQVERSWQPRAIALAEHLLSWLQPQGGGAA
jgi:hypothetical protein